ncbi:hypothetical protein EJB05_26057, partial [Eragrostis curvula]
MEAPAVAALPSAAAPSSSSTPPRRRTTTRSCSRRSSRRRRNWTIARWRSGRCQFSSRTRRWEEKVFVRDGDAAGTVGELLLEDDPSYYFSDSRC